MSTMVRRTTMPNFLVIGAAKCGTDALCSYLDQHYDVYMCPNKEPNFFVAEGRGRIPYDGPGDRETLERFDMWVTSLEGYQALFAGATTEKAVGEGTTWYLYDEDAPRRIHRHLPDAKLIAVLRNPVDRAYSAFTMLLRDGRETSSDFARALAAEDRRVRAGWDPIWHYRRMGFYHAQLSRYFEAFDAAQIRVVLYDDFNARPGEVLRELFGFLQVDDDFVPDTTERHNVSLVPRHQGSYRLVAGRSRLRAVGRTLLPAGVRERVRRRVMAGGFTRPAPIDPVVRRQVVDIFRADVLRLQELLGRDLSHWLR